MAIRGMGNSLIGELPKGKSSVQFAVVTVDYFTKWDEAEPLAIITLKRSGTSCFV